MAHERPYSTDLDVGVDSDTHDGGLDAADGAERVDAGSDAGIVDAGGCRRHNQHWGAGGCTPEIEAQCRAFAHEEAFGRYAYTQCVSADGNTFCGAGTDCVGARCTCSPGRECAPSREVCVSDTPDGPRYCVPACTGR